MGNLIKCPVCKKRIACDAPACPKCGHELTDEEWDTGVREKNESRMGCLILFVIVVAIGFIMETCDKNKTPSAPAPIEQAKESTIPPSAEEQLATYLAAVKAVDRSITDVQLWSQGNGAKTLGIFYTKDIAFKVFYTIGMDCESISKELVKNHLIDDNTTVLYFVHVPTVDKLGNKGTGLAMKIAWSGSILQKINWKNMFSPAFMNLCESVELSHLLRQDFVEFAQDKDNQKEFNDFIRTVLATNKSK